MAAGEAWDSFRFSTDDLPEGERAKAVRDHGRYNANLGDCDLTAAAVARRQHVTPRYVHKLFGGEGFTFSAFVLDRRLSRAHRILNEPRFRDRSISSVAFDVGFGDLSYFRRRYDATPSEIRQGAKRGNLPR
jgi:AraC-like DNA-binding protein